jgi:signal transduction histidine kinase
VDDRRVLVLPPGKRDGTVTQTLLERAGCTCFLCPNATVLASEAEAGAGAIVLTDAALVAPDIVRVVEVLSRQPPWSDLPVVLLCHTDAQSPGGVSRVLNALTNVTLLDRPTSARTLVSAVHTALRGRDRQYQTRDQLDALRRTEEALRMRERQLSAADRRKDEFLAMLAHELRNPMAPIRNAGELLARILPDEARMQSAVGIVRRQITHLSRLVDDLLDVSRITQGRIELQRKPVDLATVVSQAMESVEPLMRSKRHKVVVTMPKDDDLCVNGDSARLVQCVSNILTNAAKYTDDNGEIRLELRKDASLGVLSVVDNGVGISQELLPQIFDLFVQSDRSLDRSLGGMGIGLSVVKQLVEMHGGTVEARSAGPGRGATFEIRLPLIDTRVPVQDERAPQSLSARRVLIVDDNADAANSLSLLLKMEGHEAEPVYDPRDALERLPHFDPQVILLDIGLPGMDGYEVARRVRAQGSAARIVALTGYGQSDDIQRATEAGFDSHLIKPVDLRLLLREIDTM